MLAIDTNVLVRFLVDDDHEQAEIARDLVENEDLFIALTVFLEAEWVLRSLYELKRSAILRSFRLLIGLPRLTVEDAAVLAEALGWMEEGMEFADALHLAKAYGSEAFVTFDKRLGKVAKDLKAPEVRLL